MVVLANLRFWYVQSFVDSLSKLCKFTGTDDVWLVDLLVPYADGFADQSMGYSDCWQEEDVVLLVKLWENVKGWASW